MDVPVKLAAAASAGADVTSPAINSGRCPNKVIIATFSGGGSPVGTLHLQVSHDGTNYVSAGNTAVSADGTYRVAVTGGDWLMRAFYDQTSGTGAVDIWAFSI